MWVAGPGGKISLLPRDQAWLWGEKCIQKGLVVLAMVLRPHKLVIVGAGRVGDAILSDAMKLGLFGQIALIDINTTMAEGEALDQHHATALPMIHNTRVRAGGYEECADADVIVITAGPSLVVDPDAPPTAGDRTKLAAVNGRIIREVMSNITEHTREAAIIVCSNPLDAVVHLASTEFDYPQNLVFGTGTILDSARMCRIIADHLNVDPEYVRGYMIGEHGPTGFPMCSGVNVGGVGFDGLPGLFGVEPLNRDELATTINAAGFRVLTQKGWTSAGIAQCALTIAEAILLDSRSVYPVCTTLRGQYGHDGDVSLSIPCVIGRGGIEQRLEVPFDDWEQEHFEATVRAIQRTIELAKGGSGA